MGERLHKLRYIQTLGYYLAWISPYQAMKRHGGIGNVYYEMKEVVRKDYRVFDANCMTFWRR